MLITNSYSYSQTWTLDYTTGLGNLTPACNIFSGSISFDGLYHTGYAGGVTYTAGKGIYLTTVPNSSPTKGTAYYLFFAMVPTNTFVVTITTSGGDGIETLNMAQNITNYPSPNGSSCTPDAAVGNWFITGAGAQWTVPFATTTVTKSFTGVSGQYLLFYSQGGNSGLTSDGFYISKIVIQATTTNVSISPTTLNYTCGNAISQTFTTGYSGSTPPINYTWNLGSTPNGWYYNSSPAPASITTSGTTLALTVPACSNTVPKPIFVVGNFPAGTVSSSTVIPALNSIQISGPSSMCGQPTTYSISNLTCAGATYNWSASPSGNVSFSCTTCAAPTLTKVVNGSSITLAVTVNGACSASPLNFTKAVNVDAVNTLTGTYSTATNTYPLNTVNFVKGGTISGQYSWPGITNQSLTHSGSASWSYGGNGTFGFYITTGQTMNLNFSGTSTTCGTVTDTRTFVQSSFGNLVVSASPIPTDGNVVVAVDQVPDSTLTVEKVQAMSKMTFSKSTTIYLYDINSSQLLKQWQFADNTVESYNLSVVGINPGVYVLKVERNNRSKSIKIVIQ